jgi:hypothetical protein
LNAGFGRGITVRHGSGSERLLQGIKQSLVGYFSGKAEIVRLVEMSPKPAAAQAA